MADRAVAEEGGAAADRLHGLGLIGCGIGDRDELSRRLAGGERRGNGVEHVEHRLDDPVGSIELDPGFAAEVEALR